MYEWSSCGYWYNGPIPTIEEDSDLESLDGAFDIHGEIEKLEAQENLAMLDELPQLGRVPSVPNVDRISQG